MKKLKLFVMAMVAMVVAAVGVSAASVSGGVCTATTEDEFIACKDERLTRVIKVDADIELEGDITVDDIRIVVEDNRTLTVSGNLSLVNFTARDEDSDVYASKKIAPKITNLALYNTAKLVVTGSLTATADGSSLIAIGKIRNDTGWSGELVVDGGEISISGYGHTGVLVNDLTVKGDGKIEVANCAGAFNIGNLLKMEDDANIYAHDNNGNGVTSHNLTMNDNSIITSMNNKYSGLHTSGTISDNAKIISTGNAVENDPWEGFLGDLYVTAPSLTFSGNSSLEAGVVKSNGTNKVVVTTGPSDNVNLNVEQFTEGSFDAPTSGLTGVVHVGNKYYVYTLDDDKTVEVGTDTGDGTILVVNYTGKEIGVTTPDSTHVVKVASGDHNHVIYFVTLTVDGKDDKVSLFKGQTFGELSKAGKAKLDEMLNVEGQHINHYFDEDEEKLDDSYAFAENTKIHASHYVILTIGNYEFWVNPGTSLSELSEEDQAKLEAIKTDSNRKFMYFAVNGKAISEEDTKFNTDTTILVFYEGNDVPVVPDTPENPDQPTKPVEKEKADYTKLDEAIKEAEKYLDDKKYDAKEVEALSKLVEEAKALSRDLTVEEQGTIDAMVKALTDATTKVANTGDNIMSVVATGIVSLALVAGGFVLVRKNKFN